MTSLTPKAQFKFSQNSNTPILSLCQHQNSNHLTVSTEDAVHLLKVSSRGVECVTSMPFEFVKSRIIEVGEDTVCGIDDYGKMFIIDWKLGNVVFEKEIPTPTLADEVLETGPQWICGFDHHTNRIAYGYGNIFYVGDIRNINPATDVLFEEMHSDCIRDLTFVDNGSILVSSGADGLIQFFDMKAFHPKVDADELLLDVVNLEEAGVAGFSKDNNLVFSVGDDQKLRLHDLDSLLMVAAPLHAADFSGAFFIDLVMNRQVLVGNIYGDAFVASLTGVEDEKILFEGVAILQGHKDIIRNVAWNGDHNANIFTSDDTGTICVWNIAQQSSRDASAINAEEQRHNPLSE